MKIRAGPSARTVLETIASDEAELLLVRSGRTFCFKITRYWQIEEARRFAEKENSSSPF